MHWLQYGTPHCTNKAQWTVSPKAVVNLLSLCRAWNTSWYFSGSQTTAPDDVSSFVSSNVSVSSASSLGLLHIIIHQLHAPWHTHTTALLHSLWDIKTSVKTFLCNAHDDITLQHNYSIFMFQMYNGNCWQHHLNGFCEPHRVSGRSAAKLRLLQINQHKSHYRFK